MKRALALLLCAVLPAPGWAGPAARPAAAGFVRVLNAHLGLVGSLLEPGLAPQGLELAPVTIAQERDAARHLAQESLSGPLSPQSAAEPYSLSARFAAQALADPALRAEAAALLRAQDDPAAAEAADRL